MLLLHSGCETSPTAPADGFELPDRDLSVDPDVLALGEPLTSVCRPDADDFPRREWVLVDVFFLGFLGDDDGGRRGQVKAVGGKIVEDFHLPGVRAWIVEDRIPRLFSVDPAPMLRIVDVPDPARFDLRAVAVLRDDVAPDEADGITEALEALGGRPTGQVEWQAGLGYTLPVAIPDHSVAEAEALPEVEEMRFPDFVCRA